MGRSPEALERRREYDRRRAKAKNKAYYEKNKEQESARCKAYHHGNRDSRLAKKAEWRDANREETNAKACARRRENHADALERERRRRESGVDRVSQERWRRENAERERARLAKWAKDNPERTREKCARRRAAKLRAMPVWADRVAIARVYAEAVRISRESGEPHEGDHIVPLSGKHVCGLHVAANLRVIPRRANRAKGNRMAEAA